MIEFGWCTLKLDFEPSVRIEEPSECKFTNTNTVTDLKSESGLQKVDTAGSLAGDISEGSFPQIE